MSQDIAFGEGADARIAGQPIGLNPYRSDDYEHYRSFRRGWFDADKFWGIDSRPSWGVKPLPDVPGTRQPEPAGVSEEPMLFDV